MLFWYVLLLVACFSNFDLHAGVKVTRPFFDNPMAWYPGMNV